MFDRCRWCTAALAAVLAIAASGCSEGESSERDADGSGPHATLWITRDYGQQTLAVERLPLGPRSTAVNLLRRNHEVVIDKDFGNVRSIDGREATAYDPSVDPERQTRWGFYVSGVKMQTPASRLAVFPGDVVHFDHANQIASYVVRGEVGAFPQPFANTLTGIRPRVSFACQGVRAACSTVRRKLRSARAARSGARYRGRAAQLRRIRSTELSIRRVRVLVGPWTELRHHPVVRRAEVEPVEMGLFADFTADGRAVRSLDWNSDSVDTFGPGTGVLAMLRTSLHDIAWLVTGTDSQGVARSAAALGTDGTRKAFGVIATADGIERLPAAPQD